MVLLIEDEPQMRRFLRAALDSERYQLVEAATAREGLAQAAGRNPDIILLDLGLPDGDGIDLTRRLREWARMPIVVISAHHDLPNEIARLGVTRCVAKPFDLDELLSAIETAVHPDGGDVAYARLRDQDSNLEPTG